MSQRRRLHADRGGGRCFGHRAPSTRRSRLWTAPPRAKSRLGGIGAPASLPRSWNATQAARRARSCSAICSVAVRTDDAGPQPRHPLRRRGGAAHPGRQVRPHGELSQLSDRRRDDQGSGRATQAGEARRPDGRDGEGDGHQLRDVVWKVAGDVPIAGAAEAAACSEVRDSRRVYSATGPHSVASFLTSSLSFCGVGGFTK